MDRGCFSLDCLLIPESADCLGFWRRHVGDHRVNGVLKAASARANGQQQQQRRQHEMFLELGREDMAAFYDSSQC